MNRQAMDALPMTLQKILEGAEDDGSDFSAIPCFALYPVMVGLFAEELAEAVNAAEARTGESGV